jgi:hypothetical protein
VFLTGSSCNNVRGTIAVENSVGGGLIPYTCHNIKKFNVKLDSTDDINKLQHV